MAALPKLPLGIVIQALDKFTAPLQRMHRVTRGVALPFDRVGRKLDALGRAAGIDKLKGSLGEVHKSFGNLYDVGRRVFLNLAAWTALGSGSLLGLATSTAKAGEEIAETSKKLGVGTTFLQEWRFAASRSAIEATDLDQALFQLQKRLVQAAQGEGEAASLLAYWGVSATDAAGRMRPLEQLLPELQQKFAAISSETLRNAAAAQLFGREGMQLGVLLGRTSEELDGLFQRAHELGVVMDAGTLAAAEKFTAAWKDAQSSLTGVRNIIGGALLPVLGELIERLTAWITAHRAQFEAFAHALAERLPGALATVRDWLVSLKDAAAPLVAVFAWLADRVGAGNLVLGALATILGTKLVLAVAGVVKAFAGLNMTLLGTPIGWILAGFMALVAAGYLLIRNWDAVKSFAVRVWTAIWDTVKAVAGWIADKVGWLFDVVTTPFRMMLTVWIAVWTAIFDRVAEVAVWIYERAAWLGKQIRRPFQAIGEFVAGIWDGIRERFAAVHDWIIEKVRALTSWLPDWLEEKLGLKVEAEAPAARTAAEQALTRAAAAAVASRGGGAAAGAPLQRSEASVRVEFANAPPGTRVQSDHSGVELDLSMGYAMVAP